MTKRCANGWPALAATSTLLHTWIVNGPSGQSKFRTRNGSCGFVLAHNALWFDGKVEGLVEDVLDDWSYAYRPIRGFDEGGVLSNHAGYAVDLNATDHPLGVPTRETFTPAEVRLIMRRMEFYDDVIEWGGNWRRADAMHFEIAPGTTMKDVERVARRLLDSPRGKRILAANPGQKAVILS